MNTKILASLMLIGLAALAIGGGITGAYFSDTETSEDNTMAAGSLDLSLNGYNGAIQGPVVTLRDLKPSQVHYSEPITLKIFDNPGRLYKHIKSVGCTTGDVTEPECTEQGGTWTSNVCTWPNPNPDKNNINEFTWFDLDVWVGLDAPSNNAPKCNNSATPPITENCWRVNISETSGLGIDKFTSCWIPLGTYGTPLTTNEVTIRQSFHLDGGVTNWAQGDACTFDEEFMVVQENDPTPYPVSVDNRVWNPQKGHCVDAEGAAYNNCADNIDNDMDGLTDNADPDCA